LPSKNDLANARPAVHSGVFCISAICACLPYRFKRRRVIRAPLLVSKNCAILAGFNRDFRFTGQKHICATAKKESRADVNTETQKPKGKRL